MKKLILSLLLPFSIFVANAQTATTVITIGDSNNDGRIDVTDVTCLVNNVLGQTAPLTYQVNKIVVDTHQSVDLGLPSKTKWATTNLGAWSPEVDGYYYSWGDLYNDNVNKPDYTWSSYKYSGTAKNTLTKYNKTSSFGTVDNKTTLDNTDDAAYMEWGRSWSIPTAVQWKELMDNCYWEWTTNYKRSFKAGYIVYKAKTSGDKGRFSYNGKPSSTYSPTSDIHIFLPASGERMESKLSNYCTSGHYWSESTGVSTTDYNYSSSMTFKMSEISRDSDYRCYGRTIRPVTK